MADVTVKSNTLTRFRIHTVDADGADAPVPENDVFNATSSNSVSLAEEIGAMNDGALAVTLRPGVLASVDITVTVADSAGLTPFTFTVNVEVEVDPLPAATTIHVDLSAPETEPQATSTAPGP